MVKKAKKALKVASRTKVIVAHSLQGFGAIVDRKPPREGFAAIN